MKYKDFSNTCGIWAFVKKKLFFQKIEMKKMKISQNYCRMRIKWLFWNVFSSKQILFGSKKDVGVALPPCYLSIEYGFTSSCLKDIELKFPRNFQSSQKFLIFGFFRTKNIKKRFQRNENLVCRQLKSRLFYHCHIECTFHRCFLKTAPECHKKWLNQQEAGEFSIFLAKHQRKKLWPNLDPIWNWYCLLYCRCKIGVIIKNLFQGIWLKMGKNCQKSQNGRIFKSL